MQKKFVNVFSLPKTDIDYILCFKHWAHQMEAYELIWFFTKWNFRDTQAKVSKAIGMHIHWELSAISLISMATTSNTVGLLPSNGIQNNASSKFPTKAPSSTVCNLNGSMTKNVVSGQNPRQVPTAMFGGGRRQWWNLCFVYYFTYFEFKLYVE